MRTHRRRSGFGSSSTNRDRREASAERFVAPPESITIVQSVAEGGRGISTYPRIIDFNGCTVGEALDRIAKMIGGEIEVCPDCLGAGETRRHVTDDIETVAECTECGGTGWVR